MSSLRMIGVLVLVLAAQVVRADPCKVSIEANDNMQFNTREIAVPNTCDAVEVTLRHSGKLGAKVMGHDWVLAGEGRGRVRHRQWGTVGWIQPRFPAAER